MSERNIIDTANAIIQNAPPIGTHGHYCVSLSLPNPTATVVLNVPGRHNDLRLYSLDEHGDVLLKEIDKKLDSMDIEDKDAPIQIFFIISLLSANANIVLTGGVGIMAQFVGETLTALMISKALETEFATESDMASIFGLLHAHAADDFRSIDPNSCLCSEYKKDGSWIPIEN